jgi:hypothetical protein
MEMMVKKTRLLSILSLTMTHTFVVHKQNFRNHKKFNINVTILNDRYYTWKIQRNFSYR